MYSVVVLAAMSAPCGAPTPPPTHGHGHGWRHKYLWGACYGACYGVGYNGYEGYVQASGCWGLPYGGYWAGYMGYGGCGGFASAAYGMPPAMVETPPSTYAPMMDTKPDNGGEKPKAKEGEKKMKKADEKPDDEGTRAKVSFALPAGAKLYVDDTPINNAAARKDFRTPALRPGEEYYYELRAEVVRDGQTVSESKRITLRAGDTIQADFSRLGTTTGVAVRK